MNDFEKLVDALDKVRYRLRKKKIYASHIRLNAAGDFIDSHPTGMLFRVDDDLREAAKKLIEWPVE